MKIGNTDFNEDVIKKMKYKEFCKNYSKLYSNNVAKMQEVFLSLGGKIPAKKLV